MNGEDSDLWAAYGKGVRKWGAEKEEKEQPIPSSGPVHTISVAPLQEAVFEKKQPPQPEKPQPLDLRIERNLSLGEVVIEAKWDLHGQTEERAHEDLCAFVDKQYQRGRRLVLVITGKGRDGQSVLKTNVPRWCGVSPLSEKIRAVRTAAPQHGGEGAYYLLLKKKKD